MFIITEEFAEFLVEFGRMLRILSKPKNIVMITFLMILLLSMYFGMIVLADILQIHS